MANLVLERLPRARLARPHRLGPLALREIMARPERLAPLALREIAELAAQPERQEQPARLVPLPRRNPMKETGATATHLRVSKRSLTTQPAAATRPMVLKRSLATLPATTTRPL